MELLLLLLALTSIALKVTGIHVALLLIHTVFGLAIAWKLKARQPLTSMFLLAFLAIFMPGSIANFLGWVREDSTESAQFLASSLTMIGMDLFVLGARRCRMTTADLNRMPPISINDMGALNVSIMALLIFCAFWQFLLIAYLSYSFGIDAFTIHKGFRSEYGQHTMWYQLAAFASLSLPLAAFLIGLKPFRGQWPYLLAIVALLLQLFLIFRVRSQPFSVVVAYGIAIAVRHSLVRVKGMQKFGRVPRWLKVGAVLALPVGVLFVITIQWVRFAYSTNNFQLTSQAVEHQVNLAFSGGDLGHSTFTRKAIDLYPATQPYLRGLTYYRLLFVPIPRAVWPSKPQDPAHLFAAALRSEWGAKNVTIPPGIIGDLYINFGAFGVLGMFAYGVVFGQERYRNLVDLLYLSCCGVWVPHLARGTLTSVLVMIGMVWVGAVIITKVVRPVQSMQLGLFRENRRRFFVWRQLPAR